MNIRFLRTLVLMMCVVLPTVGCAKQVSIRDAVVSQQSLPRDIVDHNGAVFARGLQVQLRPQRHQLERGVWGPSEVGDLWSRTSSLYAVTFDLLMLNASPSSLTIIDPRSHARVEGYQSKSVFELYDEALPHLTLLPGQRIAIPLSTLWSNMMEVGLERFRVIYTPFKKKEQDQAETLTTPWLTVQLVPVCRDESRTTNTLAGDYWFENGIGRIIEDGRIGFIDHKGAVIASPKYLGVSMFANDVAAVSTDGKQWACMNRKGILLTQPGEFEYWFHVSGNGLFPVRKNSTIGYIDVSGRTILDCQFEPVGFKWRDAGLYDCGVFTPWIFREGLAVAHAHGKFGYIDATGHFVIPPTYDHASAFVHGLALVEIERQFYFIDKTGKSRSGPFTYARSFLREADLRHPSRIPSTLTPVYIGGYLDDYDINHSTLKNGKWGYIGTNGALVITARFDEASGFKEDAIAEVRLDEETCLINRHGEVLIRQPYYDFPRIGEELLVFCQPGIAGQMQYGYMDLHGNVAVEPLFDAAYPFSEGLAAVRTNTKWGFIDKRGVWVIRPEYDDTTFQGFRDGRAVMTKQGHCGIIDRTGNIIVPFIYDKGSDTYSDGVVAIMLNDRVAYIDKNGKILWSGPSRVK